MKHEFIINFLKKEREKTEMRIRRQNRFFQSFGGLEKLKAQIVKITQIVKINRAIFVLLKDARS